MIARRFIFVSISVAAGSVLAGFFFVRLSVVPEAVSRAVADDRPVFSSGYQGREFFDAAYANAVRNGVTDKKIPSKNAVVAHHLLVADKIAEVFETLSSDATLVVLVSPNHFDAGQSLAQTANGVWRTPYGDLEADADAVTQLRKAIPKLREEPTTFKREHGIAAITPFVKRSFPNAKLLPLVVHESLSREDAIALGESVAELFQNAVVVASIDMSHYQTLRVQEAHDAVTLRAIAGGLCETDCPKLEIDSNASLTILQAVNQARGTERFARTHHGSSLQMGIAKKAEDNTSHILGYFLVGGPD